MRGLHEVQDAANAKQEQIRKLQEAAAKGGADAPTEAERIQAVTELVTLKRKEKRMARQFRTSPQKKSTKTAKERISTVEPSQ